MNFSEIPGWNDPDTAFMAGDRIYITVEHVRKLKAYVDKLEAVAKAARECVYQSNQAAWAMANNVEIDFSAPLRLEEALISLEHK